MADVNVALLVSQTVTEAQSQSRIKMGRDYASFYEAWAVLRQRIEETKRDAKALEKLHSELWDAIKDGNEDEALIELGAINANAARSVRPSRAWRRRPSGPWRNRRKREKAQPRKGLGDGIGRHWYSRPGRPKACAHAWGTDVGRSGRRYECLTTLYIIRASAYLWAR